MLKHLHGIDPLPRLKPVGFRTQAETAGKACLTSPTPTDKTLPVFAIENRDDRNRIFTSRESIVQLIGFQNDYFAPDGILHSVIEESSKATKAVENTGQLLRSLVETPMAIIATPNFSPVTTRNWVNLLAFSRLSKMLGLFRAAQR